jgi:diguanylate cyclase (GGDEF)-like protein/PAS domain S-box-containing protein
MSSANSCGKKTQPIHLKLYHNHIKPLYESDLQAFNRLRSPIWIYDIECQQVIWANKAALQWWGISSLVDFANRNHHSDRTATIQTSSSFQADQLNHLLAGESHPTQWQLKTNSSSIQFQGMSSGLYQWQDCLVVLVEATPQGQDVFLHDKWQMAPPTTRQWEEQFLAYQIEVLAAIATNQPIRDILILLVERTDRLMPGCRNSILRFDRKHQCLTNNIAPNIDESYRAAIDGVTIGSKAGCCGTAVYRRQPVIVSDIASDPLWEDFRDLALSYGLRAAWSFPIFAENGEVLGTFCTYADIPRSPTSWELRMTEAATKLAGIAIEQSTVRHEVRRQAMVVEAAVDGMAVLRNSKYCYVNQAHASLFGYNSPEDLLGSSWQQLYDETEIERFQQYIFPTVSEKGCWRGEITAKRRDGTTFTEELSITRMPCGDLIFVCRDISDRKRTEAALQASEQRYMLAAAGAQVGVWDWNLNTNEIYIAPNLKQMLGYQDTEIPNHMDSWIQLVHPEDLEVVQQAFERHLAGETSTFEVEHRMYHRDGSVRWILARGKLLRDGQGHPDRVIGSDTDITTRKAATQALEMRDRYLSAVVKVQNRLITSKKLTLSLYQQVLEILGKATNASRTYFFRAHRGENGEWLLSQQAEWCASGIHPQIDNPALQDIPIETRYPYAASKFLSGEVLASHASELPPEEQQIMRVQNIISLVCIPLIVDGEFFGMLGFDECMRQRKWQPQEINLLRFAASAIAIAEEKQRSRQALHRSERKYRNIFENISQGIFQTSLEGKYLSANPFLARLYGYDTPEQLIDSINNIATQIYVDPNRRREITRLTLEQGEVRNLESQVYRQDGSIIWICESQRAVYHSETREFLYFEGIIEDISARKHAEEKLQYQASHDSLTGLPNRDCFNHQLQQIIDEQDSTQNYAIFFIDLDRFKGINDSLGHLVGDVLLKLVGQRLQMVVRDRDMVARFGGDEFAILLRDIQLEEVADLAEWILTILQQPFQLQGHQYCISASIGITLGTSDYQKPADLLRDADAAMYEAKSQGGGYIFFHPRIRERTLSLFNLEQDIKGAASRGEFRLYYQPIVHLDTGSLYGFEALLRWYHPQRDWISPAEFIPLAEETGSIHEIGAWVLQEACHQLFCWQKQFPQAASLVLNVNLSPLQLRETGLADKIKEVLNSYQISPRCLGLEVTETGFLQADNLTVFRDLQSLGVRISIDDFGTGYSSLSRLHELPLNAIKIDRTFISHLLEDATGRAIAQSILSLANSLGVAVVSEGIETHQQRSLLQQWGCLLGQGYLFSKAVSAPLASDLIGRGSISFPRER